MDTKRTWALILIGVGVLLTLKALNQIYTALTFSTEVTRRLGDVISQSKLEEIIEMAAPSIPHGILILILGGIASFVGTKLLQKCDAQFD